MFGAIEAGGTKFICGVGTGPDDIVTETFPTITPEHTIPQVVAFLRNQSNGQLRAVGVGSFGPVDLNASSPMYGFITSTPKPGWANFGLRAAIEQGVGVPVGFDTDVNTALLGEARWGAARGITDAIYLTIGTGVGGGVLINGRLVHGLVHPEIGHLRIPHDHARDPFEGICPYHGDCLEGLACGPAMKARWNAPASELPDSHPAWPIEARYLALGLVNLMVTVSPKRIILGGGVMNASHIFPLIRREFSDLLNGYVRHPDVIEGLDSFIVPPQLGGRAGVLGAIALAEQTIPQA
jgi:fructokinase